MATCTPSNARRTVRPGRTQSKTVRSSTSGCAVLRRGWSPAEPCITVGWQGREVRIEVHWGRAVLWSGRWEMTVGVAGRQAEWSSPWRQAMRVSQDSVEYVQLRARARDGLDLARHIMLARPDRWLILADEVVGRTAQAIEYCGRLPLGDSAQFRAADESREGFLVASGCRALVLPLALPEWRAEEFAGGLAQSGPWIELRQSVEARGLWAPLFVWMHRGPSQRPFTWRRLTVAEDRHVQPADVAVGYRVLIGTRQWLIYRSLAPQASRTVLGHHLFSRMLVARFHRSGRVNPILEIE